MLQRQIIVLMNYLSNYNVENECLKENRKFSVVDVEVFWQWVNDGGGSRAVMCNLNVI